MNGMYCPDCMEAGPDLVLSVPKETRYIPNTAFDFECGNCDARLFWSVEWLGAGFGFQYTFVNIERKVKH